VWRDHANDGAPHEKSTFGERVDIPPGNEIYCPSLSSALRQMHRNFQPVFCTAANASKLSLSTALDW
jgi:hypothetical protein